MGFAKIILRSMKRLYYIYTLISTRPAHSRCPSSLTYLATHNRSLWAYRECFARKGKAWGRCGGGSSSFLCGKVVIRAGLEFSNAIGFWLEKASSLRSKPLVGTY